MVFLGNFGIFLGVCSECFEVFFGVVFFKGIFWKKFLGIFVVFFGNFVWFFLGVWGYFWGISGVFLGYFRVFL